jgi:hypothetical protein
LQRRSFIAGAGAAVVSSSLASTCAFSQALERGSSARHRLPLTDSHYQRVHSYIEDEPIPEYRWASETAYESFRDMKYGVRIHWGLYSVAGFTHEPCPFLRSRLAVFQCNVKISAVAAEVLPGSSSGLRLMQGASPPSPRGDCANIVLVPLDLSEHKRSTLFKPWPT